MSISNTDQTSDAAGHEQDGHDVLVVSNRNILFILDYCKKVGVPHTPLIADLGYPESFFTDPDQWVSLETFNIIAKRAKELFPSNPAIFYHVGMGSMMGGSLGGLESLKKTIARAVLRPSSFVKRIPNYNHFFNKTKTMRIVHIGRGTAKIQISFHNHIDPHDDVHSGQLIKGIFASIPHVWDFPTAKVKETLLPYDIIRYLREEYSLFAEIRDKLLFIEGEVYGREVYLQKDNDYDAPYLGTHSTKKQHDSDSSDEHRAILITRELRHHTRRRKDFDPDIYNILTPGQIYNAPYFILDVEWNDKVFIGTLKQFALLLVPNKKRLSELEQQAFSLQARTRDLERIIQERNKIITDEKQKLLELQRKINRIVHSQLPPALVKEMIDGKLTPRKRQGIVMFTDLSGFSTRVNEAGNERFPELLEELNRHFEVVTSTVRARDGWVYKYMGDGTMSVFGGYSKRDDYVKLAESAIEAAKKIRALTNESGWDIRVGIEYGDFIAGEVGPDGDRLWDFLGQTVNLACRLEQHAGKNEIVLGPGIASLLDNKIKTKKNSMILKGIGEQPMYSLIT